MLHIILKKARLDAKLTMEQASERVGISQSQLSRIESKKAQVSAQRLVDLAGTYGVSPPKLLDGAVVGAMESGKPFERDSIAIW